MAYSSHPHGPIQGVTDSAWLEEWMPVVEDTLVDCDVDVDGRLWFHKGERSRCPESMAVLSRGVYRT